MDYLALNKKAWDERTPYHQASKFYDVEGFLSGNSTLNPVELGLLGDINQSSLLHLQCHFGLDSLSLARLGANVTGVDLSSQSIATAQKLASQAGLKVHFINDDVYHFGEHNEQVFDVVYTSYGALCWLPDLTKWAQVVNKSLAPGGRLVMVEFHPITDLLSGYRYFHQTQPDIEAEASYTENTQDMVHKTACWSHPVSDVISALVNEGLNIRHFQEHPLSPYDCFEGLRKTRCGNFELKLGEHNAPLLYSIEAIKE